MTTNIQPAELDDQFWVIVSIGGQELQPRGPLRDMDEAEAMAARFGAICRVMLRQPVHIGVVRQPAAPMQRQRGDLP